VKCGNDIGDWFKTTLGTRQGDPISPVIFIAYLERIMDFFQDLETGIAIQGERINNLRFADDTDLLDEDKNVLQPMVDTLNERGRVQDSRLTLGRQKQWCSADHIFPVK